ncbi:Protein C52D10.1, partial [Aphelenchoides avenae]
SDDERTSTSFYDKKVQLKNLKVKEKISVTVHLQVPKSKDGRINIELLEPAKNELIAAEEASTPKPPTVGPRLNADNILAWTVELDAGKERELVVKWSVQSPADEIVEFAD